MYWAFRTHNATVPAGVVAKNYVIILVDGVTTFASVISNNNRDYYTADGNVREGYLIEPTHAIQAGRLRETVRRWMPSGTGYVNRIGSSLRASGFAKAYKYRIFSRSV